jgi:PAS domain-containing protein
MLGTTREEILTLGVKDIHPAEHLPHVVEEFERQMRDEIELAADIPVKRMDGSVFLADISSSAVSLGGRVCLLGVFRDVTERKRAEGALRRAEENFRRSLEESPLGVRIVTKEGETIYANRAILNIYGYDGIEDWKTIPAKKRYTPDVQYTQHHMVDLVVLDMIMDPGMDGLDTYAKILEIHPNQRAISVSNFSETERVKKAQALGAGAYVRKPCVMEKLGSAVRKELYRPA